VGSLLLDLSGRAVCVSVVSGVEAVRRISTKWGRRDSMSKKEVIEICESSGHIGLPVREATDDLIRSFKALGLNDEEARIAADAPPEVPAGTDGSLVSNFMALGLTKEESIIASKEKL
jgi:hypothetical protein